MKHTMLIVRVLDRYADEVSHEFPKEIGDKPVGRTQSAGCTELRFEIASAELRPTQREYIDRLFEKMLDRLEILRNSPALKGRTLFQWRTYAIQAPRHDLTLLSRKPWSEIILDQCV